MIDPKLQDKPAIVTGASHGIGAATAITFAQQGAKVLINYYRAAAEAYGDIANAIIFLASEQADWITGQVLYVGGGNRM